MDMHVRVRATGDTEEHEHHIECERDHELLVIDVVVTTSDGGRCDHWATNCMPTEMGDTIAEAINMAWEDSDNSHFWDFDGDAARDWAADMAERADHLSAGEHTSRLIQISPQSA